MFHGGMARLRQPGGAGSLPELQADLLEDVDRLLMAGDLDPVTAPDGGGGGG